MVQTVVIAVALILLLIVLQQVMTRKRWKRMRQRVVMTLEADVEVLARKHPRALQEELCNARECEMIHHALAESGKGRERDRASAKVACDRASEAVQKVDEALRLSVAQRVSEGVVTPVSELMLQPEVAK